MAKEFFIQPRFTGPRFEENTLPLSAARDLVAYAELIEDLARHLYLVKNPDRRRIPKGFAEGFHLHLQRLDPGSAKPLLALVMAGTLFNPPAVEFSEARELVNKVVATQEGDKLPPEFPKELYLYFNRLGRSLEAGESLELTPENPANTSALTPAKRKRLALSIGATYEAEIDLVGQVFTLNTEKCEGQLRTGENDRIGFCYDKLFLKELKEALGDQVLYAHICGVGIFDVNDRLKSIKEIAQLEIVPHYALTTAVDELNDLEEGWLEGNGVPPGTSNLAELSAKLVEHFPVNLHYPAVVPTEEGHVSLEWIRPAARVELEVNFTDQQLELYATDLSQDSFCEETYGWEEWPEAFQKVITLLG
jgi:hypothetical protein